MNALPHLWVRIFFPYGYPGIKTALVPLTAHSAGVNLPRHVAGP